MERPSFAGLSWGKKTERCVVKALDCANPKEMFDCLEKAKKDLVHGNFGGIGLLQNRSSRRRGSSVDPQKTDDERKVDLLLQLWDKILSMVNRGLSIVKYIVKSYEFIGGIIMHPEMVCLPINVREGERSDYMKEFRSLLYRTLCHLCSREAEDFFPSVPNEYAEDKQNFAVRVLGTVFMRLHEVEDACVEALKRIVECKTFAMATRGSTVHWCRRFEKNTADALDIHLDKIKSKASGWKKTDLVFFEIEKKSSSPSRRFVQPPPSQNKQDELNSLPESPPQLKSPLANGLTPVKRWIGLSPPKGENRAVVNSLSQAESLEKLRDVSSPESLQWPSGHSDYVDHNGQKIEKTLRDPSDLQTRFPKASFSPVYSKSSNIDFTHPVEWKWVEKTWKVDHFWISTNTYGWSYFKTKDAALETIQQDCASMPGFLGATDPSKLENVKEGDVVYRARRWIRECRYRKSGEVLVEDRNDVDEWMRKRDSTIDVFKEVQIPFPQTQNPEDISKYIEMQEMGKTTKNSLVEWLVDVLKKPAAFMLVFRQILDIAAQISPTEMEGDYDMEVNSRNSFSSKPGVKWGEAAIYEPLMRIFVPLLSQAYLSSGRNENDEESRRTLDRKQGFSDAFDHGLNNLIIQCATALLEVSHEVVNVWLRVVLESTNGLDVKSTTRALAQLRIWFNACIEFHPDMERDQQGNPQFMTLPKEFDARYFLRTLRWILNSEHQMIVSAALNFVYFYLCTFQDEARLLLVNGLLLTPAFFERFFLNWSFDARKWYHHILVFKVLQTERDIIKCDSDRLFDDANQSSVYARGASVEASTSKMDSEPYRSDRAVAKRMDRLVLQLWESSSTDDAKDFVKSTNSGNVVEAYNKLRVKFEKTSLAYAGASFQRYEEAVRSYYEQAANGQDRIEPSIQ